MTSVDPSTRRQGDHLPPDGQGSTEEMQRLVEQLRVAEEELRVQNEELRVHREATEAALMRYQELFDLAPDPYITTDRLGQIKEANSAAARLLNTPSSELERRQLVAFVSAGMRRSFRLALNRVASGDDPLPGATEWTVKVKPRRKDEVEVAVTVATVRDRDSQVGSIRWLLRDVTARRRAEAEVRTLNAELEQRVTQRTAALEASNWAKAEFLSVMAHELRTPLNAIIGYAELLQMGIAGPVSAEQVAHLARITSSGKRLVSLVNEVLDLGKVEAGQLKVEREECAVVEAVEGAMALVMPQAAARGIHLRNECQDGAEIRFLGDQNRVEQILINLLSNSVKFTGPGGNVSISCRREFRAEVHAAQAASAHSWVAIRVHDTGIGIAPDALLKVFDPFVQVEEPLTRTQGGTGLGLTIGRRLARLMGGELTVDSMLGHGSTFTLWIPGVESASDGPPEELERRSPSRYAQGLAQLGNGLLENIDRLVSAYARKLTGRNGIRRARELSPADLEDHAAAFLADIAQSLVAVEDAHGGPSGVMRDGSIVRRIISERHGAQRHRLGWTEDELRAEFKILRKSVDLEARKVNVDQKGKSDDASLKAARSVLGRLLETAEETSIRGFRLAATDQLQNSRAAV